MDLFKLYKRASGYSWNVQDMSDIMPGWGRFGSLFGLGFFVGVYRCLSHLRKTYERITMKILI